MKVRTFTGTDSAAVDEQVNEWITKSKIRVLQTNTAFQRLKEIGKDVITGRTGTRRGVGVAISVWYDEADTKTLVDVYRLLVQAGPNGMPVAGVAKALKIAPIIKSRHRKKQEKVQKMAAARALQTATPLLNRRPT
jgi:hypothetical protein